MTSRLQSRPLQRNPGLKALWDTQMRTSSLRTSAGMPAAASLMPRPELPLPRTLSSWSPGQWICSSFSVLFEPSLTFVFLLDDRKSILFLSLSVCLSASLSLSLSLVR